MKKILWSLVFIFSWNQSFAESDTVCYSQKSSEIFLSSNSLIESVSQDIIAVQNDTELPLLSVEAYERYLPFTSNIPSVKKTDSMYQNLSSFGEVDTGILSEIILDTSNISENTSYDLVFRFSANAHRALFYISEDNLNFSQVQQSDIASFSPKKIKIVFEKVGNSEIREKIEILELALRKKYFTTQVSGIIPNAPVYFYMLNTCSPVKKLSEGTPLSSDIPSIILSFMKNISYTESISDSDNDGVKDNRDNCKILANPDQKDINQNKIGDICEFDSDRDNIPDEKDICRNIANPDQKDDDGDSIGNACDNCKLYNPDQFDIDKNGLGDRCDTAQKYIQENDEDSDSIANLQDNCKSIANPLQEDADNDGVGNVCDICKTYQNPLQEDENKNGIGDICEDSDADGKEGLQDNCPNIANPLQEDADNDGIGNICEDDDGDSILFSADNCPYISNFDQTNVDSDTFGDACDEKDDRFLESNKSIFIGLMILLMLGFITGIFLMFRKLQK